MEKVNGRKLSLIFIFILILLVIALLVGKLTFSYLGPTLGEDLSNEGEVTASGDTLIFTKGSNLSLSATTDNFQTGGSNLSSTTNPKVKLVASSKTNSASATYYVGVVINSNSYTYTTSDNTAELILTIKDENGNNVTSGVDGLTYVTSGGVSGFDVTGKKGLFNIKTDYPISTTSSSAGTTHTWTFTLTFVNLGTDQSDNENASMDLDIYLQKTKLMTLVEYVKSQYTGTQGDNGLYYHDSSLANGAGDNSYRYAGASESVNNFVCFGSTTSPCPTDNLYRIIGVFGENNHGVSGQQLVKLIKYDYANSNLLGTDGDYAISVTPDSTYYKGSLSKIDKYYWNYKNDTTVNDGSGSNTWSTSLLNKINLNTNYLNNIGMTWSNLIEDTTWKVSGIHDSYLATRKVYAKEITNATKTYGPSDGTSKIGLMYASDYGFAASPSAWSIEMSDYSQVISVNWMYMGYNDWTITPSSSSGYYVFYLDYGGFVVTVSAGYGCGSRPVLYLKASVAYAGGSGTKDSPITLVV
jgi:hypothetical protein